MVFEAMHDGVMGRAAIKILRPDVSSRTDTTARFFNEARAANAIQHPGIVRIFDCGVSDSDVAYLTMEFLEGESLRTRLAKYHTIPIKTALRTARQIASALAAAHAKQIIHRDIKPDNIMLVHEPDFPGGERVKLLDFGIAKMAEHLSAQPVRTKSDVLMGTPTYMSPEQCRGAKLATDRSDVYSLGVILYQMLAGQPPFLGASMGDLIAMHLMDAPTPLTELVPELSPKIWRLVRSLLAKKPSDRPAMEKVHKALQKLEEAAKPDPSESALLLSADAPSSDSQNATVDVPSQAAHKSTGEPSPTKTPTRSATPNLQRDLPSVIVSDSRHIHIPRRTVHLLIGALATSAVIVTTGILLGTSSTGRRGTLAQRSVENRAPAETDDQAAQDTPSGSGKGTSRGQGDEKPSTPGSNRESLDGTTHRNALSGGERKESAAKRADLPHSVITKSRTPGGEESTPSVAVQMNPAPATQTVQNSASAEPQKSVPVMAGFGTPAEVKEESLGKSTSSPPQPTSTETPVATAQGEARDTSQTPVSPVRDAKQQTQTTTSTTAEAVHKPRAVDDPFDPLRTAEDYLLQGSYRRAMDLATQFGKQDPMRAWEIFGRAGCGLRSLERAQRALHELKSRQETARAKSLTEYCRLHKILLTDPSAP